MSFLSALCVNNAFTYIKIKDKTRQNKIFILLEKRLSQLFPEVSKADCTEERKLELYDVIERMTGEKLVGLKYTPLFNYFPEYTERAFRVISDNYVTEEGGTGIVHQAPAFGEDDYRVCLLHGIVSKGEDLPCPVDANGRFTKDVPEFKGTLRLYETCLFIFYLFFIYICKMYRSSKVRSLSFLSTFLSIFLLSHGSYYLDNFICPSFRQFDDFICCHLIF